MAAGKHAEHHSDYILGLDLGTESIGWALVGTQGGRPTGIVAIGSHTNDAGVLGDIEKSPSAARRSARQARRQIWRRQWRRNKLLRLLQRNGLLPPGDISTPEAIHQYLLEYDRHLRAKFNPEGDRVTLHVLLYRLRARALDHRLELFELGRALYHLAQRRGFLSNRKSQRSDEDEGKVAAGISDLSRRMADCQARTLGEYFSRLNPEQERVRRLWTSRQMYLDEFEGVWNEQAKHHSNVLVPELKRQVHRAIFFQRPLKSQRGLLGRCDLFPLLRRVPVADRTSQRFRLLQKVNDLLVLFPDATSRPLGEDERHTLLERLELDGDLKFSTIRGRKCLNLGAGVRFNFEQGGEKSLPGHRTDVKMRGVFGDAWDRRSEAERDAIVNEILSFERPEALKKRAMKAWGLDESSADRLATLKLESGYAAHSRKAMRILIDRMKDGKPYATARREAFPEQFTSSEPCDALPPLRRKMGDVRNPAVERSLTELRKLVNAILRRFGKPATIRVELARDLKRARKERERISKENDAQRSRREQAKAAILKKAGITDPSRPDITKWLLAEECGWQCPYTGKPIDWASLFGSNLQFDVEHILPLSRSLDDSFMNKTLCYHEENRSRKRNHTPWEAYGADETRFREILERVGRFQGRAARLKRERFEMKEIPEDFPSRKLNDTRYASRLAARYLSLLYGGRVDSAGTQRIQVSTGGLTHHLRNEWMLNGILDDGGEKTREDHRHHAVDALVIALTDPASVQQLQRAAERASAEGRRLFGRVDEPWRGFLDQARDAILRVNVSRRLTKKIAGTLHAESLYSKPRRAHGGEPAVHLRKELHKLSVDDLKQERIVDPVIRSIVRKKWQELGGGDPKKVFADPSSHPAITTRDGRRIPIHKVRIRVSVVHRPVAQGARRRLVAPAPHWNHHAVIVATLDDQGNETRWDDYPVTRLEVHERKARNIPIIQKEWEAGRRFKFSLAAGEYVMMHDQADSPQLCRLLSVSKGRYEFRVHYDARKTPEARKRGSGARIFASADRMRIRKARKVRVTYLGEIVPAND